jgi:hypothetical protein
LSARAGELAEVDAPAELVRLVRRLIAASEADPLNMAVAKELRATLLALPGAAEVDPVTMLAAEVQARAAARRAGLADVVPLSRRAAGGLEDGTGGPGG